MFTLHSKSSKKPWKPSISTMSAMPIKTSICFNTINTPTKVHSIFFSSLISNFHSNMRKLSALPKEKIVRPLPIKKCLLKKKSSRGIPIKRKLHLLIKTCSIIKYLLDLIFTNKSLKSINKAQKNNQLPVYLTNIFQSHITQTVYIHTFTKTYNNKAKSHVIVIAHIPIWISKVLGKKMFRRYYLQVMPLNTSSELL